MFPCYLAPSASYSAERIFAPKELCTSTKDTPNTNDSSWMLRIMTILKTNSGSVTVTTSKHQVRKNSNTTYKPILIMLKPTTPYILPLLSDLFFRGFCCTAYFQAWFRISELAKVPETMVSRRSSSFRSIRCKKNSRAPGS